MDEVYVDLHVVTEMIILLTPDEPERIEDYDRRMKRLLELREHLRVRLEAQSKELEVGPPPES